MWRSLVAHLHGVQGVEGSNPFTPTKNSESRFQKRLFCRLYDVEYAATDIQCRLKWEHSKTGHIGGTVMDKGK